MLARHILGYAPSLIIPFLASFAALFFYTRLLTPEEYGQYALSVTAMMLIITVFFYWLQVSLPRLLPKAIKNGTASQWRATTYVAFMGVSGILIIIAGLAALLLPAGNHDRQIVWFAVPLALARALLNMNQAFHRSYLNIGRYNLIECGQAILGLLLGLALVYFLHMGSAGAVAGLLCGMACMVLVDIRTMLTTSLKDFNKLMFMEIVRFGAPLVVTCGFTFVTGFSDRFLIDHFLGASAVGIYAAGYTAMDRINTSLFTAVATPAYPLTMQKLENEGVEAAREQTYMNGVASLLIGLPACVGLIAVNPQIAAVFIGSNFREGALRVMPWVAAAGIFNGMATHYFDHAFHIAKKPLMLVYTAGPIALFNVAVNWYLIPRYGYIGAAWSTLASYVLLLILSASVGRRVFKIKFPFKPALQITALVAVMFVVIKTLNSPENLAGLIEAVATGGIVYTLGILGLNVMDMRGKIRKKLAKPV